ncbi:metallophosphoesterase family protein [Fodinicola feengrottensis]|uniref:metallophosphoesterase family protein n=1 Tax=Fodinicola feengrottensis TaxID=435914 RepID=UPI0013D71B83|nr:metallophosphoesterase [Fodinicola feengrottensis]
MPSRSVDEIAPEFRPRAPVSWADPIVLAKSGFAAGVTALMRGYSDRRVTQAALFPPADDWDTPPVEPAGDDPYWLDFAADIGDGFDATYAVAYALAEPTLPLAGQDCPRGQLLVLGGDEVYPTPSQTQYLDRTLRPYALAEHTDEVDPNLEVVAIPGNHDWYDGLDAFSELFSPGHWLGARTMNQRHSYFARRLPRGWWVLGADTALDGRLDFAQRDFFATVVAPQIQPTDSVILVLPSPFWVLAARMSDQEQLSVLRFFREQVCGGGRLRLCLSGDLHHYSRYIDEVDKPEEQVQYVTAGGGGAYLLSTHDLWRFWPRLDLSGSFRRMSKRRPQWTAAQAPAEPAAPPGAEYANLLHTYPSRKVSRNLSIQVLWRMFTNWPLGLFFCGIYLLATLIEGHALRAAAAFEVSFGQVLARIAPLCVRPTRRPVRRPERGLARRTGCSNSPARWRLRRASGSSWPFCCSVAGPCQSTSDGRYGWS